MILWTLVPVLLVLLQGSSLTEAQLHYNVLSEQVREELLDRVLEHTQVHGLTPPSDRRLGSPTTDVLLGQPMSNLILPSSQLLKMGFREKLEADLKRELKPPSPGDDKLWMRLPWKLGKVVHFPVTDQEEKENNKLTGKMTKKVFLAPYPNKIQGGEFYSFAMVEKACRDAGTVLYNHGGFRALLTTKKRPLSKLLPPYMYNLPVVNIAGEQLAADWGHFVNGTLATNFGNKLIGMTGQIEAINPRWNWKYYWIGDGRGRTCGGWSSSYLMDVASVIAFDYENEQVVGDIASCSTSLHFLCYAVSGDQEKFL